MKKFNAYIDCIMIMLKSDIFDNYTRFESAMLAIEDKIDTAVENGEISYETAEHQLFTRMRMIDKYAAKKFAA